MSNTNRSAKRKYHNFFVASATGASFTDTEWDTNGIKEATVLLVAGALGTSGLTVVSIHAADTAGFTPGAGNIIASITGASLPADADDGLIWEHSFDPREHGRYVQLIVTAGAQACVAAAIGIGDQLDEAPNSAAEQGVEEKFAAA